MRPLLCLLFLGVLSAPSSSAQTIEEFPVGTFSSTPPGIVLGSDGAMWFPNVSNGHLDRITLSGQITEVAFLNSGAEGISSGPDGNLWLTLTDNVIARVTTAGSLTRFHLPTANASPSGIAAGPDGNLWIAEFSGNRIARMTPAGTVVEFPLPTPGRFPTFITAGPDGALWFSEPSTGQIGRITTGGAITEFPLPHPAFPGSLAFGPDGNLWFTTPPGNKIGRMTPVGAVTEYPLPGPDSYPSQIVPGPDGAMWFTERFASKIGRIAMDGEVTEFSIPRFCPGISYYAAPPTCTPQAIARGPQGDLWFTEITGIGRVLLGPGSCTVTGVRACLNGSRFEASIQWDVPELGTAGSGTAVQLTGDSAFFWFFTANNAELLVKVVDGRAFNDKFWVFYGGLSNVHYTITVRDTVTGTVRTYVNPNHALTSVADTTAF